MSWTKVAHFTSQQLTKVRIPAHMADRVQTGGRRRGTTFEKGKDQPDYL